MCIVLGAEGKPALEFDTFDLFVPVGFEFDLDRADECAIGKGDEVEGSEVLPGARVEEPAEFGVIGLAQFDGQVRELVMEKVLPARAVWGKVEFEQVKIDGLMLVDEPVDDVLGKQAPQAFDFGPGGNRDARGLPKGIKKLVAFEALFGSEFGVLPELGAFPGEQAPGVLGLAAIGIAFEVDLFNGPLGIGEAIGELPAQVGVGLFLEGGEGDGVEEAPGDGAFGDPVDVDGDSPDDGDAAAELPELTHRRPFRTARVLRPIAST